MTQQQLARLEYLLYKRKTKTVVISLVERWELAELMVLAYEPFDHE